MNKNESIEVIRQVNFTMTAGESRVLTETELKVTIGALLTRGLGGKARETMMATMTPLFPLGTTLTNTGLVLRLQSPNPDRWVEVPLADLALGPEQLNHISMKPQ